MKVEGPLHVVCQCDKCKAEKQEPVMGVEVKRVASGGLIGNVWWIHENLQEGVFHLYTHPPQRTEQEPVAFKIYKPTPPRHVTPNVRDAELPWVYDQDPSSGNVASMWVTPVKATPPQRTEQEPAIDKSAAIRIATALGWEPKREWVGLTDEEIEQGCKESWVTLQAWQSAVWWAESKLKQKNGYAKENT